MNLSVRNLGLEDGTPYTKTCALFIEQILQKFRYTIHFYLFDLQILKKSLFDLFFYHIIDFTQAIFSDVILIL